MRQPPPTPADASSAAISMLLHVDVFFQLEITGELDNLLDLLDLWDPSTRSSAVRWGIVTGTKWLIVCHILKCTTGWWFEPL